MAERAFQTDTWSDPFIQNLSKDAKLLFIYLWTNKHCNQAGLYEITSRTISFDTLIDQNDLPALFKELEPKVIWYENQNLVWVKNFLRRQCKSSSFLTAAGKSLKNLKINGYDFKIITDFIEYNREKKVDVTKLIEALGDGVDMVVTPSQHGVTTPLHPVPVPDTVPDTVPEDSGVVKGDESLRSESEEGESLYEGDQAIISAWRSVKGFDMSDADAQELVVKLRTEFPGVDLLDQSKKWAVRKLNEPLNSKSRPASQLWNWMGHALRFSTSAGPPKGTSDELIAGKWTVEQAIAIAELRLPASTEDRHKAERILTAHGIEFQNKYLRGPYGHRVKH